MPFVEVKIAQGRSPDQVRALISGVTAAVEHALDAPRASIRVIVHEIPRTHWAAGDVTIAER